jgi:hypothetical protein
MRPFVAVASFLCCAVLCCVPLQSLVFPAICSIAGVICMHVWPDISTPLPVLCHAVM